MTQAQATDLATRAQRVQQLIQQAEGDYSSGIANYRGGRLEAARADFDMAVDLMLTRGMDVKNDPQLSDEFEHLLNAINSLEMSALKEGTGFSAPIEAAPLDAADEVTFPANAELTAKVEEELKTTQSDFPLVVNDYVAGFINYFSNSPAGHAHRVPQMAAGIPGQRPALPAGLRRGDPAPAQRRGERGCVCGQAMGRERVGRVD